MSTEAQAGNFPAADWGGGVLPYRVGHRKLGMWLFIVSDSLTFSALLIGYAYLRVSNVWPTPFPFYPSIVFSSVMTFCLLSSSLTMVFGVSASSRGDKKGARKWILATIFFGLTFVVLHMIEWNHLISEGLRPFYLPEHWVNAFTTTDGTPPTPLFGATFFAITGLHMFHVLTGAVYLAVVAARVNKLKHEDVEISGLYWHFVDLVWMFVFPLIYILSVDVGGHLAK
ncbi:MAG TPA: cytochrome c oxidase subunit 3 [Pyrinomonadaceae bacterium]|nr:cytochrome c oxidase subunit 3 [Pyrinomonadaceae bacterium]